MKKKILAKRDYKRYPNYKTWTKWKCEDKQLETKLNQLITEWLAKSLRAIATDKSPTQNDNAGLPNV